MPDFANMSPITGRVIKEDGNIINMADLVKNDSGGYGCLFVATPGTLYTAAAGYAYYIIPDQDSTFTTLMADATTPLTGDTPTGSTMIHPKGMQMHFFVHSFQLLTGQIKAYIVKVV